MSDRLSDVFSLGEVCLGFGGRTAQILGTVLSGCGVLYAINMSSGHGISVMETLPYWLGVKKYDKGGNEVKTSMESKQFFTSLQSYGKLLMVILTGTLIKKFGIFMCNEKTVNSLNEIIYGTL